MEAKWRWHGDNHYSAFQSSVILKQAKQAWHVSIWSHKKHEWIDSPSEANLSLVDAQAWATTMYHFINPEQT